MNRKLSKKELLRIMSKRFKKDENPGDDTQQPIRDTEDGANFLKQMQQLDALADDAIKSYGPSR